jgi:biopolymer transport protein ExbD
MKRIDSINVIPFIDVMLVLLAIVLATATFIVEGRLEIQLPTAEGTSAMAQREPTEIAIDRAGGLFLDAEPITIEALSARLAALDPETPIRLRVDAAAEFGGFVSVVDMLQSRGLDRVRITTRQQ